MKHRTAGIVWRLVVCASIYVALYLVFGYFVAWRNPEVRSLYGGDELLSFVDHIRSPAVTARLIPLQFLRGIVWTLLCLGLMRSFSGGRVVPAIVIGLVLAVVMNAQLLIPNPIMSQSVRMVHLAETAASNFLFAVCCVACWSMGRSVN